MGFCWAEHHLTTRDLRIGEPDWFRGTGCIGVNAANYLFLLIAGI